jgi:hypothetical protein
MKVPLEKLQSSNVWVNNTEKCYIRKMIKNMRRLKYTRLRFCVSCCTVSNASLTLREVSQGWITEYIWTKRGITVDSRLSARGLTALRLNRGNVFLKKKFYFP